MRPPPFVVKVCGITEAGDGLCAVEAGANALGFNFYPQSPRSLSLEAAGSLMRAITGSYLRVGVFVNATEAELKAAAGALPLDVLQLHGQVPASLPPGYRVWQAVAPGVVSNLDDRAEAYLIDTPSAQYGGSGVTYDWRLVVDFPRPAILAGGLDETNVADAIEMAQPWGVDACSRLEVSRGRKDKGRMEAFIMAALQTQQDQARQNQAKQNHAQQNHAQKKLWTDETTLTL